jgi:Na+-translocating ferredoxin:NAD+ oxidoreductase RnfG subunit
MKPKTVASCRIALFSWLAVALFTVAWAEETTVPSEKLAAIFPNAKNFVEKKSDLTPEKVTSIEAEIETNLRPEDLKPTFYIAVNENEKPIGLALFVAVEGPNGVINGGVGLDMTGKVVKVDLHKHSEAAGIADDKFLRQFIGKGIADKFEVGEDIEPLAGEEAAAQAVALMPKKMLAISYALFLKRPAETEADAPEMIEPEDLKEVMAMMKDEYDLIRAYFQKGAESKDDDKAAAVQAAKRLRKHTKLIDYFEPPKNSNETKEYTYFQQQFHSTIDEFAQTLAAEGISEKTQKQWQEIIDVVNKAHLRFSVEEIDLDEDLN